MGWSVTFDDEFLEEFRNFPQEVQDEILANLKVLKEEGPYLGRPYADKLNGAETSNLKELIIQVNGKPWRVLFAFKKDREGVLLAGGDKGNDKRFYKKMIKVADERFRRH